MDFRKDLEVGRGVISAPTFLYLTSNSSPLGEGCLVGMDRVNRARGEYGDKLQLRVLDCRFGLLVLGPKHHGYEEVAACLIGFSESGLCHCSRDGCLSWSL